MEATVIEAVLDFYKQYLAKDGRKRPAAEVKKQLGTRGQEFTQARKRAAQEVAKIDKTIDLPPKYVPM